MKIYLFILFITAFFSAIPVSEVFSMEPADSTAAEKLYTKAGDFWRDVQFDSSNFYYEKASSIFEKNKNWKNFIDCQKNIGINYRYLGDYQQAFSHLNKGLNAVDYLNENKDSLRAELYDNIGNLYFEKGDYSKAYKYYRNMLEINERTFGEKHTNTGKGYQNVGLIFSRTGEYEKAIRYFNKALAIWDSTLTKDNLLFANCYSNLSEAYYMKGEYSRSIEYEERALRIWTDKLGEGHPYVASGYSNLADKYSVDGDYTDALENEYKAMQIRRDFTGEESGSVAESYTGIGKIFLKMGNLTNGSFFLNKSISIYRKVDPSNHGLSDAYMYSGDLAGLQSDYETAEAYYDSALNVVWPGYKSGVFEADSFDTIPVDPAYLTLLNKKGKIFFTQAEKTGDRLILKKAFNTFILTAGLLKKLGTGFGYDETGSKLSRISYEVNKFGALSALELYRLEKDHVYIESAIKFSERNKTDILADAVVVSDSGKVFGMPDSLVAEEKDLHSEISFYRIKQQEAIKKNNPSAISKNRNILFETLQKYDELQAYLQQNFPAYYELINPVELKSSDEIRKLLPNNAAVVEYFSGDTTLSIFILTKNELNAVAVDCKQGFFDNVRKLRESLLDKNYLGYFAASSELYLKLLEPVKPFLKGVKKLYIIPDYILTYLPFEALLTKPQPTRFNGDFSDLPYLINDYEISYQYSAGLLKKSLLTNSPKSGMLFAGFAPVFLRDPFHMNNVSTIIDTDLSRENMSGERESPLKKFFPLPETENEIKTIGNLFRENDFQTDLYLKEASTINALKTKKIYQDKFIHLAVPGYINDMHPQHSGLVFYGPETDSTYRGILYIGDIYSLNLNADLLVLDACESGLGKEVRGEGIYSLTTSFLYAGINNTVLSSWRAPGNAAPILMSLFYKNILDGMSYAASLRKAKLDLIKGGIFSNPFEWSPYVLVGR